MLDSVAADHDDDHDDDDNNDDDCYIYHQHHDVAYLHDYSQLHPRVLASIQRSAQLAFRRGLVDRQRHVQQQGIPLVGSKPVRWHPHIGHKGDPNIGVTWATWM